MRMNKYKVKKLCPPDNARLILDALSSFTLDLQTTRRRLRIVV
jgi:hypothetical protein